MSLRVPAAIADELYQRAEADRWQVPPGSFASALERSAAKAFPDRSPSSGELRQFLGSLRLGELALACACEAGSDAAWDHFVLEYRPILYRAADALDSTGRAREIADSLYAELYGLRASGGQRSSLFRYFHGRSSLATWLRAVLAQRHVDLVRADRRAAPLPEEEPPAPPAQAPDPDEKRLAAIIHAALRSAVDGLEPRDRLRLSYYYAQGLTLAQAGRLLGEHEATVSRHLAATRKALRRNVEQRLRTDGLGDDEIDRAFECASADAGPLDVSELLSEASETRMR